MNPPSILISSLLVVLGGGIGAWLRFVAGRLVGAAPAYAALSLVGGVIGLIAGLRTMA